MRKEFVQQMLDKILPMAMNAIEEFERDEVKFPLFELHYDKNKNFNKITFNDGVENFIGLLLGCKNFGWNYSDEPSVTKRDYNNFVDTFFMDIKMALLKDAVVNLTNYIEVHSVSTIIQNELFYEHGYFKKKVIEYISKMDLDVPDELIDVIDDHVETIHLKVPKICFPWYVYALCYTYKRIPKSYNEKRFNIIIGEFLTLKWMRSKYPIEQADMERAQKNFKAFIKPLADNEDTRDYNCSLNLSLFNETTNLYDIFNVVNLFSDDPCYMEYQRLRLENKQVSIDNDKHYRKRNKSNRQKFKGVGHIAAINTLGIKTLLIDDYYVEQLFTDERVWNVYNKIFDHIKRMLLQEVKVKRVTEYSDVPEEIRLDYCVYVLLNKEDPYKEHLEGVMESGLPIYIPSTNQMDTHLYEAYSYAYKSFYDCRSKTKKRISY